MDVNPLQHLRETELFAGVDPDWLSGLVDSVRFLELSPGVVLFDQGAEADEVFVICDGTLEVVSVGDAGAEYVLGELTRGAVVGEIAVLTGDRRNARVRAVTEATVAGLSPEAFNRLLADHPDAAGGVVEAAAERLQRTQLTAQVVQHLGLTDLADLAEIEKELDWVRLAAGDWLFREGDPADAAYLVAAGRLQIVSGEGAHEEFVAEIGRGEIVGEMAVIEGGTRTASAVAIRDTQLVRVPDSAVSLILERFPQVFLHLTRMVLRRARRPARQSIAEQLSVAVVPLAPIAEVRDLCAQLSAGLSTLGATVHLWSDRVDALLGRSGIAQSSGTAAGDVRLVPWLNEVESASRFVIFETDSQWSAWSERVLRQCDRVLFVADANGPMAVSPLEAQGLATLSGRRHPHTSLVLLHDPATGLPSGTSRWLEHRPVDDVHHLRRGFGGDVSRVVRILAGKGVSLVLSGGGARGFAQLGVIRAMHEVGIPIDLVAGTSIGSVIGAGVALDLDDDEAASLVADRFRNIMDWTLPVVSVLRGKRISANLVAQFGMTEIEDLWLPYLCVSASLTRPRAVVHRRGSVATAIRASVAIPGVLPPVPYGDELLVDGGVIDNLPVAVMRRVNPNGPLVAVDVTPAADSRPNAAFGLSLSGWEAIRMRLASKGKSQTLSLSGTVLASMLIGATRDRDRVIEEDLADLYLAVDAGNCGPFDWDAVARVAATGYRSALPAVAAWASELGW